MPKRKIKGPQAPTLPQGGNLFQASFDLGKQDQFVTSLGVQFVHFKAMPSPIGLKDRGDYRRPDSLDTISSNGMLYKKCDKFTAALVSNTKGQQFSSSSVIDYSTCRVIMPRFYDKNEDAAAGKRIYLAPGDRVYINDPDADVKVSNYQKMEYTGEIDIPMYPICELEFLIDSRNIEYRSDVDFKINEQGNIQWIQGGNNPGIDPDTKQGRVYSIRYLYKAYWYVLSIPNEIRITNVSNGDTRSPQRMAEHAILVREYIYHQKNNGDKGQTEIPKGRGYERPLDSPTSEESQLSVNISDFTSEEST